MVYFNGQESAIENVRVGERTLRLLVIDDKQIVTRMQFLDYHQPLSLPEIDAPMRETAWAENVALATVECMDKGVPDFDGFMPAPFIDWSKFRDFDSYWTFVRHRSHKVRELDRLERKFQRDFGPLMFNPNDCSEDVIDWAVHWKRCQLRETGHRDYFEDLRNVEFFQALRDRKLLLASTMRLGDEKGRLLAASLGVVHARRNLGWVKSFDRADSALQRFSIGNLLTKSMLQESFRRGEKEFDFSVGGHDYKWMFATHARLLADIGRVPLQKRFLTSSKVVVRKALTSHPQLLEMAKRAKRVFPQL